MEEQEKEEKKFKVIDKRRFDSEGNSFENESVKSPDESQLESKETEQNSSSVENSSDDKAENSQRQSNEHKKVESQSEAFDDVPEYSGGGDVNFASFVVSLGTQALAMMGEASHPELENLPVNFEAARQSIDIIAILEEKTRGNLTPEESKLVSDLLSSLRMVYVSKKNS